MPVNAKWAKQRGTVAALSRVLEDDDPRMIAQRRLLYLTQLIHVAREAESRAPLTPAEADMVAQLIQSGAR